MVIENIQPEDAGEYECLAYNEMGRYLRYVYVDYMICHNIQLENNSKKRLDMKTISVLDFFSKVLQIFFIFVTV